MAVEIKGRYLGKLNVELEHGPSGAKVTTAAPVDNNGDGSSFSPTDMVAAALGACMVTIMGIVADREGIDLGPVTWRVEKHMESAPRRIGRLPIRLEMPAALDPEQRKQLERAALACPVAKSLADSVAIEAEFVYS